ncbi:hypothetical protein HYH03_004194 [Edaphochlamys debaryana]|uniref:Uncharacterized protein n=1 Tax=Edaphochlamys debaryana TaxID=47281 RepID=A0A835YAI9_9CHLO|nr:hypothetical protein HYH03_004194 [Edaphochlamys debaryana]|eukprot:KAG2497932.1 hypothetical protein HYH03_004194 [Edaphochlamys debaryana]
MALPNLRKRSKELVQGESKQCAQQQPALSLIDQALSTAPAFGLRVLLGETLAVPLLREALSCALTTLPQFSGRLQESKDGRTYDVACTNEGARLVVYSTSASLSQLQEAMDEATGSGLGGEPWAKKTFPTDPSAVARKRRPLLSVFGVYLSGGGTLLCIKCMHALADFEALQTFASHFSAAYNDILCRASPDAYARAEGEGGAGGKSGKTEAAAAHGAPTPSVSADGRAVITPGRVLLRTQPPPDRRSPMFDPARVEALALEELPPGVPPLDGAVEMSNAGKMRIVMRAVKHLLLRGGGSEDRSLYFSPDTLAALKRRANAELTEERAREGPGGPLAGVEWVSSNDALVARLMQLLHSAPIRRPHPMTLLRATNMRPRLEPPLPVGFLGNAVEPLRSGGLMPADLSLGRLAGLLRRDLTRQAVAHVRRRVWELRRWAAEGTQGAANLMFRSVAETEPTLSVLAPEGPISITSQSVKPGLWQFGPDPLLCISPVMPPFPNIFILAPAVKGGMALRMTLHRCVWRQLDALFPPSQGGLAAAF